jgi:hypothetical protein
MVSSAGPDDPLDFVVAADSSAARGRAGNARAPRPEGLGARWCRAQQAGCAWCSTMRRTEPSRTVSM